MKNILKIILAGLGLLALIGSLMDFNPPPMGSDNQKEAKVELKPDNTKALSQIRAEQKVKEAIITDANVLYVSVADDGTRRDGYADYICQLLKQNNSTCRWVKVVAYGTTKHPKRDNAYGILIGESKCEQ